LFYLPQNFIPELTETADAQFVCDGVVVLM